MKAFHPTPITVAGKKGHKGKLELSPQEIVNMAAYWGRGGVVEQVGRKKETEK